MPRGKLTDKQIKYTELVAEGKDPLDAAVEAGYLPKLKHQTLAILKSNKRVNERIEILKGDVLDDETKIASRTEREAFWTKMMTDPKNSGSIRLEASKLLGKAQGDFIDLKQIDTNVKTKPIIVIPNMTPDQWEKYWETEYTKGEES